MIDVGDDTFERVVLLAETPVVVDFWAPWCGPCKGVERVLADLETGQGDLVFVRMNVDEHPATASRYGVLSLPTVMLFASGQPRGSVVGARRRGHYERWLSESAPSR